eukprot:TRINITY_DN15008_c0_g1_i1.p1 TRINITY_DN15008_c0_g1~~TRINITY_DN15008_c0_g1_i1.p1  ORF type:complete len:144 (-),score=1.24 TRINITY_DN15008_c0_g1_i1:81-512(-)
MKKLFFLVAIFTLTYAENCTEYVNCTACISNKCLWCLEKSVCENLLTNNCNETKLQTCECEQTKIKDDCSLCLRLSGCNWCEGSLNCTHKSNCEHKISKYTECYSSPIPVWIRVVVGVALAIPVLMIVGIVVYFGRRASFEKA